MVEYLQITGSVQHILSIYGLYTIDLENDRKHRSVNNVLWRVVAGRIKRGRGPDAARGTPVGHP